MPQPRTNYGKSCSLSAALQLFAVAIKGCINVHQGIKALLNEETNVVDAYNRIVPRSNRRFYGEMGDAHEVYKTLCGLMPPNFRARSQGMLLDQSVCSDGHVVTTHATYTELTVYIPSRVHSTTLHDLLMNLFEPTRVTDYSCATCGRPTEATVGTAYMQHLPLSLLNIVINRQDMNVVVDIHPRMAIHDTKWQLMGMTVYISAGEHWVAYVLEDDVWWRCDDTSIVRAVKDPWNTVEVKRGAQLLLYRRQPRSTRVRPALVLHDSQ